jgi:hypothetical protein
VDVFLICNLKIGGFMSCPGYTNYTNPHKRAREQRRKAEKKENGIQAQEVSSLKMMLLATKKASTPILVEKIRAPKEMSIHDRTGPDEVSTYLLKNPSKNESEDDHHLLARTNGGGNEDFNLRRDRVTKHRAWHTLFGTLHPIDAVEEFNKWTEPGWEAFARRVSVKLYKLANGEKHVCKIYDLADHLAMPR